ncbi:hypothetical protein YC2023_011250 [Brassica napus]
MVSRSSGYLIDKAMMKTNHSFSYQQGLFGDATSHSFPFGQGGYSTNGSFSMYFYLPDKNDGLEDLNPKFKIAYGLDGQDLGLRSMVLYHKACVKIDEEGAEAAAVTFAYSDGCSMYLEPPKRIDFVADHPYLFLIREDKTGTVLFVGQIFDPSDKSA